MKFKGMYSRLALKKEPVNVAVNRVAPLINAEDLAKAIVNMGVSFEDARAAFAAASFVNHVPYGVLRSDGTHGFGELRSFRSGYRRSAARGGWGRVGRNGPWMCEMGGVS